MKLSKDLELSDWQSHIDGPCRYRLLPLADGGSYHGHCVVMLYAKSDKVERVRFYGRLFFCDAIYNPTNAVLDLTVEEAKRSVDEFLQRIGRTMAFA